MRLRDKAAQRELESAAIGYSAPASCPGLWNEHDRGLERRIRAGSGQSMPTGGEQVSPRPFRLWAVILTAMFSCFFAETHAQAQETPSPATTPVRDTGTRRALVICGLPGDDDHRKLFATTVEKLHKALLDRYRFSASEILVRFGAKTESSDGPALSSARGLSDREGIAADVAEMRKRLRPEDTLWVFVIGHAHFDGRHTHLNIPGPDLDERAFAKQFDGLKSREQIFFITTQASGFFLKPLAAPGRIVITATEADQEVNETLFPHILAETLAKPPEGIDRDKDGKISVFELYLAVVTGVMKQFVADENLPTEHAKLDDNGDGHGSELQESYLPPELGSRAGQSAEPKFGPKDDGFLSSKTFIDPDPPRAPKQNRQAAPRAPEGAPKS